MQNRTGDTSRSCIQHNGDIARTVYPVLRALRYSFRVYARVQVYGMSIRMQALQLQGKFTLPDVFVYCTDY